MLDLLTVGMGMGVPFFTILLGFPLGWYFARRADVTGDGAGIALRRAFRWSVMVVVFTVAVLAVLWGPVTGLLWDPSADLANFGIPLILYEPRASFIGWIVLMVFLSPCLQLLATAFGSSVRLAWFPPTPFLQTG